METRIRHTQALINLAKELKITPKELYALIEKRVNAIEDVDDFWSYPEYAGRSLWKVINDLTDHSLQTIATYVLGKGSPNIDRWFSMLQVWGVYNECPECGCEMEAEETTCIHPETLETQAEHRVDMWRCTNCDYIGCTNLSER